MTHGSLLVRVVGEPRSVLLNTTHSASAIPMVARMAPGFSALESIRRLARLPEEEKAIAKLSRSKLRDFLAAMAIPDGVRWPPAVASWIVAARPNFLTVIPPEFVDDLAAWSGINQPLLLLLGEKRWTLYGKLSWAWEIDPLQMAVDAVYKQLRRGLDTTQEAR